MLSTFEMVSSC